MMDVSDMTTSAYALEPHAPCASAGQTVKILPVLGLGTLDLQLDLDGFALLGRGSSAIRHSSRSGRAWVEKPTGRGHYAAPYLWHPLLYRF